ncbi:putative proline-specific permease [Biscogniauxia marginata]|nr:putative proline-specific permease [Biscogniauxia marginata]
MYHLPMSSDNHHKGVVEKKVVLKQTSADHDCELNPSTIADAAATKRGLKSQHAQMIALGGVIGTGLFVGIGGALSRGGPLFTLLAYVFITLLVYGVATATGEMNSYLPVSGGTVATFANRFVSRSFGFTLGWVLWYIFTISVPAEINAAVFVLDYWDTPLHDGVWIAIIVATVILCNFLPVSVYGEVEFWFASTKVIAILGLLILSAVLFFGGGPSHRPLWFSNWDKPGPTKPYILDGDAGRLVAIITTTTLSVYAFAFAPELLVVTSGELESPRANIPRATKRYFYRLVLFYILGALAVGIIVPSNHPDLLSGGSGAAASPWAIGIREAGIGILDDIVNGVIALSAWSAANSCFYLSSRSLYSMAVAGNAPKKFTRCTKAGVPIYAAAVPAVVSLLAFMNVGVGAATVFQWFVNLISTGGFQSWICCCFTYVRFRSATEYQGIIDIPYRSRFQPYTAWFSGVTLFVLMLLSGMSVFISGQWNVSGFLTSYIGIPIFVAIYAGHRLTEGKNDPWAIPIEDIDLKTGLEEIVADEKPPLQGEKWYQKWKALFE